ncbi:MAG: hypothetical protein J6M02_05605 [Clostridia bacterium]|nr:hypothetical protein [Clostridia bacterium]
MEKNLRKIAGATLMAASLLTLPAMAKNYESLLDLSTPTNERYQISLDNMQIAADAYKTDDFIMIKLRDIAENGGIKLLWNPETETVGVESGANKLEIKPGEKNYKLNKEKGIFYGKTEIKEGRTYVSPEFFELIGIVSVIDGDDVKLIRKSSLPENAAVIKSISKDEITVEDCERGEVRLVLSKDTKLSDADGKKLSASDLYIGAIVEVDYSDAMTFSLPPVNVPVSIRLLNVELVNQLELEGNIEEISENYMILKDVENYQRLLLNMNEETKISHITGNKRIYRKDDLEVGMKVKAIVSYAFTRSIPAQTYAYEIIICE